MSFLIYFFIFRTLLWHLKITDLFYKIHSNSFFCIFTFSVNSFPPIHFCTPSFSSTTVTYLAANVLRSTFFDFKCCPKHTSSFRLHWFVLPFSELKIIKKKYFSLNFAEKIQFLKIKLFLKIIYVTFSFSFLSTSWKIKN